jgi:hypothetical protein
MDLHQPVMKTHRDLIAWVGAKFNPSFGIVEQLTQSYRNLPRRNSDITFVFAIFARPSPNIAQRAPVQIFHELFSEQIALAPQRPSMPTQDIVLLGLIQFVPVREMCRDEITQVLRRQQRGRYVPRDP